MTVRRRFCRRCRSVVRLQRSGFLSFRLRMDAGGPTAPLVNAMLEPALLPATEDLAQRIAAHVTGSGAAQKARA